MRTTNCFTRIVSQHTTVGHKIRMEALNMEVVDVDRRFQEFVLYLFNDDILAVNQYKDISRPQVNRVCPALYRGIERMPGCGLDLLPIDEHTPPFLSAAGRRNCK